ncbi:MAG: NADH-quinone oxidoreductase subunit L [Cyclobacteriaceae bacterium]
MSVDVLIALILILPLIGGLSDCILTDSNRLVSSAFIAGSFLSSLYLLITFGDAYDVKWEWLNNYQLGIFVDKITAILLVLVSLISLLVHIFSMEYMRSDVGKHRYFAMLGFFTFSMFGLLVSDHLILLFVFWELVGFSSYLLIGFWYQKEEVPGSARMAFMVNRIADVALLAGILLLNTSSNSIFISEFDGNFQFLPSMLIAIGAFGKSAQLPFSGWLVKAMVGPTPVSALIHAATMVAAGVYLLFRVGPFLSSEVLIVIAFVGATTALYGALSAVIQNDIKRILAYSTISQLGYMVMGIGVGAGEASLFHLWTHAFFKAGLFLGAGVVIHHLHQMNGIDGQDMRLMGGLRKKLPWTFVSFTICGLALAGIPFFSGFMSKEGIVLSSWEWAEQYGTWAYLVPDLALITILITAFYVGRLILLTFTGESRLEGLLPKINFKESIYLKFPVVLLALCSIWLLYNLNPFEHDSWLDGLLGGTASLPDEFISIATTCISILLSVAGLILAFFLFRKGSTFSNSYQNSEDPISIGGRIMLNGLYLTNSYGLMGKSLFASAKGFSWVDKKIDSLLHFVTVGSVVLAKVLAIVDRLVVDGFVNLLAWVAAMFGKRTAGLHAKETQWQLIWLLIAIVLILTWILFF